MTTTDQLGTAERDYLVRLRAALADLPPGEVEDILGDVEVQLAESGDAAELARLGRPEAYAAELRAAAGYPAAAARAGRGGRTDARVRLGLLCLGAAVLAGVACGFVAFRSFSGTAVLLAVLVLAGVPAGVGWLLVRGRPGLRATPEGLRVAGLVRAVGDLVPAPAADLLRALVPAWWVGRAGLAAVLLLGLTRSGLGSVLLLGLVLVLPSAWVAHRARSERAWRWASLPLDGVALGVLLALPLGLGSLTPAPADVYYADTLPVADQGLSVSNIYAFDAQGRPLTDVYLYDQDGQPIQVWEYTCYDGTYELQPGVDQEDPPNRFPLPHVEPDPVTGRCEVVDGLPFSVAIPGGTTTTTTTTSPVPGPSSGAGPAPAPATTTPPAASSAPGPSAPATPSTPSPTG